MVIDDHTFYLHSFEDKRPMLIDYEHIPGGCAESIEAVIGLARKAQEPNGGRMFAGTGAQLLRTPA